MSPFQVGLVGKFLVSHPIREWDFLLEHLDLPLREDRSVLEAVGFVIRGIRRFQMDGLRQFSAPALGQFHRRCRDLSPHRAQVDRFDRRILIIRSREIDGRDLGNNPQVVPIPGFIALVVVADFERLGCIFGAGNLGVAGRSAIAHALRELLDHLVVLAR